MEYEHIVITNNSKVTLLLDKHGPVPVYILPGREMKIPYPVFMGLDIGIAHSSEIIDMEGRE